MSVDLVIKNGLVVTHEREFHGGVAVDGGRIVAVGPDDSLPEGREVVDAGGKHHEKDVGGWRAQVIDDPGRACCAPRGPGRPGSGAVLRQVGGEVRRAQRRVDLLNDLAAGKGNVENQEAFLAALRKVEIDAPRGKVKLDAHNNPIHPVYVLKVEKKGGALQNSVTGTYPNVSQFWKWSPEAYLTFPTYPEMKGKWAK
jgi:hypothetical protein